MSQRRRREKRDERRERETRIERRMSKRIKVRVIIFLNFLGQNEKSADFTGKSGTVCI
jgi:hypothetical protein